ncbi:DUF6544 family protein [Promethearchaeum syntrophicum]|uniref:DUF6544 family protein n=1 Tax=Promethearchaeum syntrophicum TaxID=2594042 RepID=A0A5B9DCR5_9ARCH|nr:DUF6544 family protein [Candidatus Prometheoarchaeum syntrophicum]QEE16677.1 hypothetical protein DSAG12_02507 [Candidatus Prometheoarchaeum syntrophicum]
MSKIQKKRETIKSIFHREIEEDMKKYTINIDKPEFFKENDIIQLPPPVQRYFKHCGYIGKEKMANAQIKYESAYLKMSKKQKWINIQCRQYNSVHEPTRIIYMKSKILGIFRFEGRDKYHNGIGNMLVRLLKRFTVVDALGKEMDASALVTVLAEVFLVPSYALQPYVKWQSIDDNSARATLTFNETKVSAMFHFNSIGEMTKIDTDDRYFTEKDGTYANVKWSALMSDYIEKEGIKFPSEFKGVWHFNDGDFEYFKGKIAQLKFNISSHEIFK